MSRESVGRRGLSENIVVESKLDKDDGDEYEPCGVVGTDAEGYTDRCCLRKGHDGPHYGLGY